jgi:hypothetical protein
VVLLDDVIRPFWPAGRFAHSLTRAPTPQRLLLAAVQADRNLARQRLISGFKLRNRAELLQPAMT